MVQIYYLHKPQYQIEEEEKKSKSRPVHCTAERLLLYNTVGQKEQLEAKIQQCPRPNGVKIWDPTLPDKTVLCLRHRDGVAGEKVRVADPVDRADAEAVDAAR